MGKTTVLTLLGFLFGSLSFIFAVIAENKKAPQGTPLLGDEHVICNYPKDRTVLLGYLSIVVLVIAAVLSHLAVFGPYKSNSVKIEHLFKCTKLLVFFTIAEVVTASAIGMTLWATLSQSFLLRNNIHRDMETQCPTAKTGLIGGAGFMSLNASLLWYIAFMLSQNRKRDLFDEECENHYDASLGSAELRIMSS